MNSVRLVILNNGDQIIGNVEMKRSMVLVTHPLKYMMKTIDGEPAISLSQYIPFIDPSKPFVDFVETSVLSIVDIDEDLIEYYNNTVLYNLNEANPILKQSLKDINTAIRPLLSDENKSFNDAVRHYQVNLDSTKIH